jgi:ribosomal protein L9
MRDDIKTVTDRAQEAERLESDLSALKGLNLHTFAQEMKEKYKSVYQHNVIDKISKFELLLCSRLSTTLSPSPAGRFASQPMVLL